MIRGLGEICSSPYSQTSNGYGTNHSGLVTQPRTLSGLGLVSRHGDAGSSENTHTVPNPRRTDSKDVAMFWQLEGDHGSRDPPRSVYQLTNSMYQLWKWMALQSRTYCVCLVRTLSASAYEHSEMVGLRCGIVEGSHRSDLEMPQVKILVVVATIQVRYLKADVEKGSLQTVIAQGLIDPKLIINFSHGRQRIYMHWRDEQKGMRFIFLNDPSPSGNNTHSIICCIHVLSFMMTI